MKAPVLIVGAGGVGGPAALALCADGIGAIDVLDDDLVDVTNLHRQILFGDGDVGRSKLDALVHTLKYRAPHIQLGPIEGRALPHTVLDHVTDRVVVIDATDNFASRFLIADACALAGVPVVHAAAVRWRATVFVTPRTGRPCYRCLFEEPPAGDAPDCATAGVVGPVCGVAGAVAADRAYRVIAGDPSIYGSIVTYDGLTDRLRTVPVAARPDCPLCGERRSIHDLDERRYAAGGAHCAGEPPLS